MAACVHVIFFSIAFLMTSSLVTIRAFLATGSSRIPYGYPSCLSNRTSRTAYDPDISCVTDIPSPSSPPPHRQGVHCLGTWASFPVAHPSTMDVFGLRERLIEDYGSYVRSFIRVRDPETQQGE